MVTNVIRFTLRRAALVAVLGSLGGGSALAQQPAAGRQPGDTRQAAETPEAMKRRFQIRVMEGVLVSAVRHGADLFGSELRPINPNLVLLTGMARARGFVLDGYGIFFDVEIPGLRPSVAWTISTMAFEPDPVLLRSVAQLRQQLAQVQEPSTRAALERSLAQIERQMQASGGLPLPEGNAPAPARRVSSANTDSPVRADVDPPAPVQPMKDPNLLYTEAVKKALIDAMLDHSGSMGIGPEEWLTVAAKDAEGPLGPGEPYDAITMILRIKGSDLAAFRADRLTRDEARTRVEVREF